MDRESHDELDRMIDRGLAGYAACEPLAGLEERVLNRVRLANARRRRPGWRRWAVTLPVLAALIVWAVVSKSSRVPVAKLQPLPATHIQAPAPERAPLVTRAASRRHVARRARALPKRNQFPTPTPLTAAERSLIAVAELPPLEKSPEEIQIAPIEIPPLQIDGN
jgi:hypothetical protein